MSKYVSNIFKRCGHILYLHQIYILFPNVNLFVTNVTCMANRRSVENNQVITHLCWVDYSKIEAYRMFISTIMQIQ